LTTIINLFIQLKHRSTAPWYYALYWHVLIAYKQLPFTNKNGIVDIGLEMKSFVLLLKVVAERFNRCFCENIYRFGLMNDGPAGMVD
jgi:hypothetical protein